MHDQAGGKVRNAQVRHSSACPVSTGFAAVVEAARQDGGRRGGTAGDQRRVVERVLRHVEGRGRRVAIPGNPSGRVQSGGRVPVSEPHHAGRPDGLHRACGSEGSGTAPRGQRVHQARRGQPRQLLSDRGAGRHVRVQDHRAAQHHRLSEPGHPARPLWPGRWIAAHRPHRIRADRNGRAGAFRAATQPPSATRQLAAHDARDRIPCRAPDVSRSGNGGPGGPAHRAHQLCRPRAPPLPTDARAARRGPEDGGGAGGRRAAAVREVGARLSAAQQRAAAVRSGYIARPRGAIPTSPTTTAIGPLRRTRRSSSKSRRRNASTGTSS